MAEPATARDRGEQVREDVNNWIRTSGTFDGVIDFDQITRDPQNPNQFNPLYDSGDHLHPNDAGYKAMGEGIDLKLFASRRRVSFVLPQKWYTAACNAGCATALLYF